MIQPLFQRGLNISQSYIESNLGSEKYGFADRLISFNLLNEKYLQYMKNLTTNNLLKSTFLTIVHIVAHSGNNQRCIQNSFNSLRK